MMAERGEILAVTRIASRRFVAQRFPEENIYFPLVWDEFEDFEKREELRPVGNGDLDLTHMGLAFATPQGLTLAAPLAIMAVFATVLRISESGEPPKEEALMDVLRKSAEALGLDSRLGEDLCSSVGEMLADLVAQMLGMGVAGSEHGETGKRGVQEEFGWTENLFLREREHYVLKYGGGRWFILPESAGLQYLQYLVRNQGQIFRVEEIDAMAVGTSEDQRMNEFTKSGRENEMWSDGANKGFEVIVGPVGFGSKYETMDARSKREIEGQLADLRLARKEAERNSDNERTGEITKEIQFIEKELRRAFRKGRSKALGDQSDQIRKNVSKALRRTLDKIKPLSGTLYSDLNEKGHLKIGWEVAYQPPEHVDWEVS